MALDWGKDDGMLSFDDREIDGLRVSSSTEFS